MFKKLIQFEIFYQLKQRAFPIFAILFLALGVFVGRQGFAPKGVSFNAVYQVYFYTNIFTLGNSISGAMDLWPKSRHNKSTPGLLIILVINIADVRKHISLNEVP